MSHGLQCNENNNTRVLIVRRLIGLIINAVRPSCLGFMFFSLFNVVHAQYISDPDTSLRHAVSDKNLQRIEECFRAGANPNRMDRENFRNALMEAAWVGDAKIIKRLLNGGAKPDLANKDGFTALMVAADYGHFEAVKILVEHGAKKHAVENRGLSALMLSTREYTFERRDIAKYLLLHAKVNARQATPAGITALHMVTHPDYAQLLLKSGAKINQKDKLGRTPLMMATNRREEKLVSFLLKNKADITAQDKEGRTSLSYATNEVMAKLLLDAGSQINHRSSEGTTALMQAAENGKGYLVEFYIRAGADVNIKSRKGVTALGFAMKSGDERSIEALKKANADSGIMPETVQDKSENNLNSDSETNSTLEAKPDNSQIFEAIAQGNGNDLEAALAAGADVNAKDANGDTPLIKAAKLPADQTAKLWLIEILLRFNAGIDETDRMGYNALMHVCSVGSDDFDSVGTLIKAKINVNAVDSNGQTALMKCAKTKGVNSVKTILAESNDINRVDNKGWTALMHACLNSDDNVDTLNLLIASGANVNIQAPNGFTAMVIAARINPSRKHVDVLQKAGALVNFK